METTAMPRRPIVYVRGYASVDVEAVVDDPFYGFNNGSTHVRVGDAGTAILYEFESPLLRLVSDHGYTFPLLATSDSRSQSDYLAERTHIDANTIWVYRYYDTTSSSWGNQDPQRLTIEAAAEGLLDFINLILSKTGDSDGGDKVHLVAHSMGGLICRSLIQKICPDRQTDPTSIIDKLFTYATPHGGIHFVVPLTEWLMDHFGPLGANAFGQDRLKEFLTPDGVTPPEPFVANRLPDTFPHDHIFCCVGTNQADYGAAAGLSRRVVGPQSDGLVQIESAYVEGCPRAYIHRSHSGRYGIVNSEEGYHNLERFLFGTTEVKVSLSNYQLPRDADDGASYQLQVRLAIRGLPVVMTERLLAHYCPIILTPAGQGEQADVLFTSYLLDRPESSDNDRRYAVTLSIFRVQQQQRRFIFGQQHFEQVALWDDVLFVDLTATGAGYWWKSEQQRVDDTPRKTLTVGSDGMASLPLPAFARTVLGDNATIVAQATRRGAAEDPSQR